MSLSYVIAWLLPLVAGVSVYCAFGPARGPGWRSAALGHGVVLGLLIVSALTALAARSDTTHAWLRALPWVVGVTLIAALVTWGRLRLQSPPNPFVAIMRSLPASDIAGSVASPRWQHISLAVLFTSLLLRALIALREIWLRPLYPWDAWSAWAVKAKTWFLVGHYAPYVSMRDWLLQAPSGGLYTGVAEHYPNALAWLDVWFASAAGSWIEPLINLPWLAVWLGLLFAHYGQWRALGVDRVRALFFVYVLGSLPLLTVHAAVAGYADMWVAALFGFAMLAWLRWLQQGDRGQLALALVCAAVLPTLKLEGLVWTGCFYGAVAFGALPSRWRWRALIVAVAAFFALIVFGGAKALLDHYGWNTLSGQYAMVLSPGWHGDAAAGIARTLFAQPNWHLLWWLVLPVVVWRWRELIARDWLWLPGMLLSISIGLLLFLFLFTDASSWAKSFTAINRLVLQLTPAMVSSLALLLRDARLPPESTRTTQRPDPPIGPA
jgi:hypothetical protein